MANYYYIRLEDRDFPKLFFRVVLIREDLPLETVGAILASCIGSSFEHAWLFADKNRQYLPEEWIQDYPAEKAVSLRKKFIKDFCLKANRSFFFEYDTGDSWDYDCYLGTTLIERKGMRKAYCLDGAGAQIFEDDHSGFIKLLSNKKLDDCDQPWDYSLTSKEAFLKKIDPTEFNQKIVTDLRLLTMAEKE